MVQKQALINELPPFENKVELIMFDQGATDIVNEILTTHKDCQVDYDTIASYFDTGDVYTTAELLWWFLKKNVKYTAEELDEQTVKTPAAILQGDLKNDCKHYSLFIGGVLDSIKFHWEKDLVWCYRFAGYEKKKIEHVFVVIYPDTDNEIWVDPVLDSFDEHLEPKYYIDKFVNTTITGIKKDLMAIIGQLFKISGIGNADSNDKVTVQVDLDMAKIAFVHMVNEDQFGLKTIMQAYPQITNTKVKDYCDSIGLDFRIIQNCLK